MSCNLFNIRQLFRIFYNFLLDYVIIGTSPGLIFYSNNEDVYEFNLSDYSFEPREDLLPNGVVLTDSNYLSNTYDSTGCVNAYLNQEDEFTCTDSRYFFGYFQNTENLQ
mgnify:CR=1 FL=1